MTARTIIFRIEGGRELEWKYGDDVRFALLFERMREAVLSDDRNIVFNGEFDAEQFTKDVLTAAKGFRTFVMFRSHHYNKMESGELLEALREDAVNSNYPELVDKTYTGQLVRMFNLQEEDAIWLK